MKRILSATATLVFSCAATMATADTTRDCVLAGTVQKNGSAEEQNVSVKFHSMDKYDQESNCRVRRGEKMEFQLPDDPRLNEADAGSPVKYRYRTDSDGSSKTELISVGT